MQEVRSNPSLQYKVLGFLDDDPKKGGFNIMGAIVLGRGRDAAAIVDRFRKKNVHVDEIVIAMPSASGVAMHQAVANCKAAGVVCKTIPGVSDILTGEVLVRQIRNVKVEDLLGRKPVQLDETLVRASVEGQCVMITGGAGSVGSELCRQIASFAPAKLLIFEMSEAALFHMHRELTLKFPKLCTIPIVGDVKDESSVERAIRHHGVQSIFHAAAYKHVPLMETHLLEAVKNNILGTSTVAKAALYNRVSQFVMISSDKAVNPTSIMGLTKRVAELVVSTLPLPAEGARTKFLSVRFGNVLGSSGSVVPLFEEQIASGGPVTVTHPEMRRYFMTTREAVQLVLQASTMGKGSEVFVLDMGEPVPIVELARNMIRLAGKEPGVDVEIRFVGVRPGEKLFEEVLLDGENILPTYHEKIRIFCGPRKSHIMIENWLVELEALVAAEDDAGVLSHLVELVPEYQPPEQWVDLVRVPDVTKRTHKTAKVAAIHQERS